MTTDHEFDQATSGSLHEPIAVLLAAALATLLYQAMYKAAKSEPCLAEKQKAHSLNCIRSAKWLMRNRICDGRSKCSIEDINPWDQETGFPLG